MSKARMSNGPHVRMPTTQGGDTRHGAIDMINANNLTRLDGTALEMLDPSELRQVEGGEVATAAIVGAVALGGAAALGIVAAGALIGWGLWELTH